MTSAGFIVRVLACFAIVFASWNPSGYSFVTWAQGDAALAAKVLGGATLLTLHILFFRSAWLSLGPLGLVAALAVGVSSILALSELDLVDLRSGPARGYLTLTVLSVILAVGVSWSLMKRRITGQSNYLNNPP